MLFMFLMFLTLAWNFTHLGHRILEGKNNTTTAKIIWMFSGYPCYLYLSISILVCHSEKFYFCFFSRFLFLLLTWTCRIAASVSEKSTFENKKKHEEYFDTGRPFMRICLCSVHNISFEMHRNQNWKCCCSALHASFLLVFCCC